jgi:hypothetical protein
MTSENFVRFSGIALMIGGLLATSAWILFTIFDPRHVNTAAPTWRVFNLLVIFGGVFMAMGLPGLFLSQSGRAGLLIWPAMLILFIGIVIPYIAVQSVETATAPDRTPFMMILVSIGAPSLFIGSVLTAAVIYTSGVFPQWIAVGLIFAVLLGLLALLVPLPHILARGGIISAIYTLIMTILGYFTYTLH